MSAHEHLPGPIPPPVFTPSTPPPAPPPALPPRLNAIQSPPLTTGNASTNRSKSFDESFRPDAVPVDPSKATATTVTESKSTDGIHDEFLDTEVYSAHLNKYVKEVRRRRTKPLQQPKLADFQVKDDDNTVKSTKWLGFIEAWIIYIISSAAYDELDRPLEPFSLSTIKHDVDRLYPLIAPFIGPARKIKHIYRWDNKALTGALASFYLILWYYDLVLAFASLWLAVAIITCRFNSFAQYGVEALASQPEVKATAQSWDRKLLGKMKSTIGGTRSASNFNIFDHLDVMEWRKDITTKHGPKMQMIFSDTVDYLERMKNLLTWKRPAKTRFLLILVATSSLFLSFIPVRFIAKFTFLYVGFEFFVLQALRSHYPRHRRLFNILNLLLWDVPNDAEYALEVVKLSQHSQSVGDAPALTKSNTWVSMDGLDDSSNSDSPLRPTAQMFSVSMSDLTDHLSRRAVDSKPKVQDKPRLYDTATSTATSLAMLAAAAAAHKMKKTVDTRTAKKKKETEEAITTDDPDAFGCMYKGTIPGRMKLEKNSFVFQTTRMAGARVLVECAYKDIVGVKKTKQYNMFVWHSSGIDISTADGVVLRFENVLRRDECFNRLVIASGNEGGEWKKM